MLAAFAAAFAAFVQPDPSAFVGRVDNLWFPLRPGTTWVYRGAKDGRPSRDVVTVERGTTTIAGVRCTAVRDRLFLDGKLAERTTDWYAQDRAGNVWYFGEATAELDPSGRIANTEGSWRAGVDGARPGILMPARPTAGQQFAQEHYAGHAEDRFQVLRVSGRTLLTKEWTPLEPGVIDHKRYTKGVGMVSEATVRGGSERAVLVSTRHD
jgi:hypothetical protein